MTEEVGKVRLDYSKYPGEDFYCDGAVEDELLDIVKNTAPEDYTKVIEERLEWPVLYHLSPLRRNIVDWIPMEKDAKVLEVGSGCGAVTGALAEKAGSVDCVDLSRKRSLINACRNSRCGNVTIHVGNFKDIEPELPGDYDFIFLIGVFEYGQSYIGGERPYHDFLNLLTPHLAPGGRLVIAIENKYGLKYFAGCREDHLGAYFAGIENYAEGGGVRTFSRPGLEKIFGDCGIPEYHFYYPYPDYKFTMALYSDEYLPGQGELSNNICNYDRDRMVLFDEKNAFDGLAEDGLFPVFANSFLVVAGGGFDTKFVKYSNDRAPEYAIRTEIGKKEEKGFFVRKYPIGKAARAHVENMAAACAKLEEKYRGGRLEINKCRLLEGEEPCAEFEFVRGRSLAGLLDECLKRGDQEAFYGYFQEYVQRIGYNGAFPFTDLDLVFANILVDGDRWTLIDYEWTEGRAADVRELAFRAVYCYLLENGRRNRLDLKTVMEKLGITEIEANAFREAEAGFQSHVTGGRAAMTQLWERMGRRADVPQEWIDRFQGGARVHRVQIYEDRGAGCSEEASYFVQDAYRGGNLIEMELALSGDVRVLRIDPAFVPCAVKILRMDFNGRAVPLERRGMLTANGEIVKPAVREGDMYCPSIVFPTEDPNLSVRIADLERQAENMLCVRMEVTWLTKDMALDLAKVKRRR